MAKLSYTIKKTGRRIDYVGLSNTALIRTLKTSRFNNRVLGNKKGVDAASKMIKAVERLKKLPNKNSYYARTKRKNILGNLLAHYDTNNFKIVKLKSKTYFKLEVPKLKVTQTLQKLRGGARTPGGYNNFTPDELEQELDNVIGFWEIINNMGGWPIAYKKYQHAVERLAERFGVDLTSLS